MTLEWLTSIVQFSPLSFHFKIMAFKILWIVNAFLFLTLGSFAQTLEVTFDNHPQGVYSSSLMEQDFNSVDVYNGPADRFNILADINDNSNQFLRVTYPAGAVGASNSGGQFITHMAARDEYYLDYYIRFDDNFDFQLGGKIPGLSGGESNTGGDRPTGDGWSARFMWREEGKAVVYLYHMDQPTNYGHDIELNRSFQRGQWHRLTQRIKVNSGNNNDGILQVWFDGELVILRNDIRYRNNNQALVDHFYFSTFFGGNTSDWAPDITSTISYDNIRIGTSAEDIIPDAEGSLLATVIRPNDEAVYEGPASVSVEASAFSINDDIENVFILNGEQEIASFTQEPFSFNWENIQPGTYTLRARAEDSNQNSVLSSPITITVTAPDPEKGPNLALNRPVSTSSEQEENLGQGAVDGSTDPEDRWSAQGFPQSITVDLESTQTINLVELLPYQNRAYQYTVESSVNGSSFTQLVDRSGNRTESEVLSDPVPTTQARYLRFTISGAHNYTGSWTSIIEVRAFDTNSSSFILGDASGNHVVTALDASIILMIASGIVDADDELKSITDLSGDGDITTLDAILLLEYIVGLTSCFPPEAGCG